MKRERAESSPPKQEPAKKMRARGKGSICEVIPFQAEMIPRSSKSNISTRKDDDTEQMQKATEQVAVSSPPPKRAGTSHVNEGIPVRTEAQKLMEQYLQNRRLNSLDLIEDVFGDTVSVGLATDILLGFIRLGVVELTFDGKAPTPDQVIDACVDAHNIVHSVLTQTKRHTINKSYGWKWGPGVAGTGEQNTARFLNVVAVIAYHVASSLDGFTRLTDREITTLWTHLSYPNRQFRGVRGQDCRPDLIAIPLEEFTKSKPPTAEDKDQRSSLYNYIKGNVLTKTLTKTPNPCPNPNVTSNTNQTHDHLTSTTAGMAPLETFTKSKPPTAEDKDQRTKAPIPGPNPNDASNTTQTRAHLKSSTAGMYFDKEVLSKYDYAYVNNEYIDFEKLSCTGEVKMSEHSNAITQEMIYMEQQRLAQPQRHFVLGLAVSNGKLTLSRADSMGTEECTLSLDCGSGFLEAIRVILGFATANQEDFGQSPHFERSEDGKSWYFKTPSEVEPSQHYYLHHLADDNGSLVGRMTRVFCAYREVKTMDEIVKLMHEDDQKAIKEDEEKKKMKFFVGPYALKIQYVDRDSISYKERVGEQIKKVVEMEWEKTGGMVNLLLPEETYEGENVIQSIRGFPNENDIPEAIKQLARRQEIITVSLFKRTLAEYESFAEVARAVADGYRAIEWLKSKGFLHRDISDGNLLLSREERTLFKEPYSPNSTDLLCRRKVSSPEGVYGLLHDFDMAGLINTPPAQPDSNRPFRNGRTGTPPFMSIRVLKNNFHESTNTFHMHGVADDVESLFYVLYLFPFSNGGPQVSVYPNLRISIDKNAVWPEPIMAWVRGRNSAELGDLKAGFFNHNWRLINPLLDFGEWIKKHWPTKDEKMKEVTVERREAEKRRKMWHELVTMLHDKFLWWNMFSADPNLEAEWSIKHPLHTKELLPQLIKALDEVFSNNREDYTL